MGDRSNIVVVQPDNSRIWLYGHWLGEDNYRVVGEVLSQRLRWGDHAYLARMLFDKMTEGALDKETGFGISTAMCDNEHFIIALQPDLTVVLEQYIWGRNELTEITPPISFEDFVGIYSYSTSLNDLAVNMGAKLTPA
jgi:hypothetical protein